MCSDLELGMRFFHIFSMFEYSMKACGFYELNGNGFVTGANWGKFVKTNKELFDIERDENSKILPSINYLLQSPPKQQALNEEKELIWRNNEHDQEPDRNKVSLYIRRVRNNLFHGGKFKGNYFSSPERSRDLIKHSSRILEHLIESNADMRAAYMGAFGNNKHSG